MLRVKVNVSDCTNVLKIHSRLNTFLVTITLLRVQKLGGHCYNLFLQRSESIEIAQKKTFIYNITGFIDVLDL